MPVPIPTDDNHAKVQITPSVVALATTYDATVSASTAVTFNSSTTLIEVCALDKAILMKWGTVAVTTSNFDEVIPANTVRHFYVPKQSSGVLYTGATFIEQAASAVLTVIEK